MSKLIEVASQRAEYVTEDGTPTGEAIVAFRDFDGVEYEFVLCTDDAELLGDSLVRIASARPRASTDNIPNDHGAGI